MPYAYGATIEHEFDGVKLNIWLTFRHPMDQTVEPALNLWTLTVDTVDKAISDSDWIDEFTLWLEAVAVVAYPDRVLLAYDGPSGNLQTTWGKDWEPWGDALSIDIGKGKCFIDRGDPAAADFAYGDLTHDSAWRDLDLSAIAPETAQGVCLYIDIISAIANRWISFRKNGNANEKNISSVNNLVSGFHCYADVVVPLDADRKIEYFSNIGAFSQLFITVKNWWF